MSAEALNRDPGFQHREHGSRKDASFQIIVLVREEEVLSTAHYAVGNARSKSPLPGCTKPLQVNPGSTVFFVLRTLPYGR